MTERRIAGEAVGQATRYTVRAGDAPLSAGEVLQEWATGSDLCAAFTRMIGESPHAALFWEMPPLDRTRLADDYECVLIGSTALARLACDPRPFGGHFGDDDIAVFPNLGGDALLVAPAPLPAGARYTHLAAFCRRAPRETSHRFWQRLGEIALQRIADEPVWVSTAGLGVGWLHARLDSRPKYYSHEAYRRWP